MRMRIRCDVCGKFISYKDLENKRASRFLKTPDSHFTKEEYVTLCRTHNYSKFK